MRRIAFAALLLAPVLVRADRSEWYTTLAISPAVSSYRDPLTANASGKATLLEPGGELAVYYGVTNTIHVGAAAHLTFSKDIGFSNTTVTLSDGNTSNGSIYENQVTLGLGALFLYRFDTRTALAPVVGLELGLNDHMYSKIVHIPAGTTYSIPYTDRSECRLVGRTSVALEYRFLDRLIASVGLTLSAERNGLSPWQVAIPLRFGVIW